MPNWFEELTGFREECGDQVRQNIALDGELMTSRVNGRSFRCGRLKTLAELRKKVSGLQS